jgi:pilus assembly protein CpaB
MKRKLGGSIAALVLAVFGTVVLVAYVQSAKDKAVAGERLVDVLVVSDPIAKGTAVADIENKVDIEKVPAKVKADQAVSSVSELPKGSVAVVDLVPGEQVVATRFASPVEAADGRAAGDHLTVTVSLAPERALGGQVQPGDTVAVFASFAPFDVKGLVGPDGKPLPDGIQTPNSTHIILHKIPVTAVQIDTQNDTNAIGSNDKSSDAANAAPTGNLLVSLAVDGPSAERIVFAAEHGTVWLASEPSGAPETGTKIVTRGNEYS